MIDEHALIDPRAELDEGVSVGPFSVIGANVRIGKGCWIGPHCVIKGQTRIGRDNRIFQFASVGEDPQDKKYSGEPTVLEMGDRNVVREFVTIHRGTAQDAGITRIGNDNLLMAYTHVAHDCGIADHVILANAASLGGHVHIQDWAILGGFTIVHQFCHIGAHAFCAMGSVVSMDVPTFVTVGGNPAKAHGINAEGLKRRGFDAELILAIKRAYKTLYKSGMKLEQALEVIRGMSEEAPQLAKLADFLDDGGRGIVR